MIFCRYEKEITDLQSENAKLRESNTTLAGRLSSRTDRHLSAAAAQSAAEAAAGGGGGDASDRAAAAAAAVSREREARVAAARRGQRKAEQERDALATEVRGACVADIRKRHFCFLFLTPPLRLVSAIITI